MTGSRPSAVEHPANAGLRRHRERSFRPGTVAPLARPGDVVRPYETLGTHPDLVERLWDQLPAKLSVDCRVVFFGAPALMHPATHVVFAFAGGTHTYALRLPEPERTAALQAGGTRAKHDREGALAFDLRDVGEAWVFCGWFRGEEDWCLAAYELAGRED